VELGDGSRDGNGRAALPFGHIFLEGKFSTMADYLALMTMDGSYMVTITCQWGMCGMLLSHQKGVQRRVMVKLVRPLKYVRKSG